MQSAIAAAMKKFGVDVKGISKLVYSGPDARTHAGIAGALKFDPKTQVQDGLFGVMGNTGAAHPLMLLVRHCSRRRRAIPYWWRPGRWRRRDASQGHGRD